MEMGFCGTKVSSNYFLFVLGEIAVLIKKLLYSCFSHGCV